jgi:tetratricopeptide (TPR) repeat protein
MAWYPVSKELILIGSNQPINLEFQGIEQRLQNPVINKIMSDIEFDTPYSFLGSIWFLKNELKRMSSGERIISDNNPSLEFFLDDPRSISEDEINKIVESRSSFEDVWGEITQSSYFPSKTQKVTFKKHWDNRLKADNAETNFIRGTELQGNGKNSEAIDHYKMAIKIKPDYALAHNNLGIALVAEGKIEEAISHFKMAIKIKPNFAEAYSNLGSALSAEGKIEEAISHYKMAIKIKPNFAKAHYNLGIDLVAERKIEEAISHFKMAIKIKPDYAAAYNNLGAVLFNAKMTEEAINSFKEAIRIRPGFAEAQKNLEAVLLRSEELE